MAAAPGGGGGGGRAVLPIGGSTSGSRAGIARPLLGEIVIGGSTVPSPDALELGGCWPGTAQVTLGPTANLRIVVAILSMLFFLIVAMNVLLDE